MKCIRCGKEFESPGGETNVCGNCADDLRAEDSAYTAQANAEADAEARARWETEETERMARDPYQR